MIMDKLDSKSSNRSVGNLEELIQSYLAAIDNKNKNEIENLFKENKKFSNENDIVFEMYNKKQLNSERLQFIINKCRKFLNISSCLIKGLMETNNKTLLEIILKYGIKFFDEEIIVKLLNYYKNKKSISDYTLNKQLDNDKYKIPIELNYILKIIIVLYIYLMLVNLEIKLW